MAPEKEDPPSSSSAAELEIAQGLGVDADNLEQHERLARLDTKGIHEFREDEGYVLDQSSDYNNNNNNNDDDEEESRGVKRAADGHTRLIPQPSDDPNDPLNWSWRKKHTILFVVAMAAFLPDYGSATGAVTLQLQAE